MSQEPKTSEAAGDNLRRTLCPEQGMSAAPGPWAAAAAVAVFLLGDLLLASGDTVTGEAPGGPWGGHSTLQVDMRCERGSLWQPLSFRRPSHHEAAQVSETLPREKGCILD